MAITTCWGAKGGIGTTVVVAGIALAAKRPAVLVDLAGDLPAVLGLPEPAGQGLAEWLASNAHPSAVLHLAVAVDASTHLIPRGVGPIDPAAGRWAELGDWMATDRRHYVVDCGSHPPPPGLTGAGGPEVAGLRRTLLVTRPCYLALRRACTLGGGSDGVIVVDDHLHALDRGDVAHVVGATVVATVPTDPAVARAVDAGLLAVRVPGSLLRPLRPLARPAVKAAA